MKTFEATKVDEKTIELKSSERLEELYQIVENSEKFILKWKEGDVMQSKIIIGSGLAGSVKSGDIQLRAKEPTGEKK